MDSASPSAMIARACNGSSARAFWCLVQEQQEMNKLMLDAQTLQMRNQQELFGLLQSRLERVSYVMEDLKAAQCSAISSTLCNTLGFAKSAHWQQHPVEGARVCGAISWLRGI